MSRPETQPALDLAKLRACRPSGLAALIHLYLPGYLPSRRERSLGDAPMCGSFLHLPKDPATGELDLSPLDQALAWPSEHRRGCSPMRWCSKCIGHLTSVLPGAETWVLNRAIAVVYCPKEGC